jgi:hypothetical protein|tara:strand:+ start:16172 stop:17740 length:1569 start_codon:yes stop_codon:yes gene_type:complete
MAERYQTLAYKFQGGYATDLAPEVRQLNFLQKAENVMYDVSGAFRKAGGANRINGTAIASGANITGMYHFYVAGTSGTFANRFVVLASDGTLHTMNDSGATTDITGGATITANTVPVFAQLSDVLTFWTSDNNTPLQITSSGNAATLTGSPPAGRGAVRYANRLFAYGINATPSSLRYSAFGLPQTWTGADTGLVTADDDDGDIIIGALPYKGRLAVFKGPNWGSIHILSGRSIDEFRMDHLISGVPLQSPNGMVSVGDDIWWLGDNGVYSLEGTEKTGDFQQADQTRFLKKFFRELIDRKRMNRSWAVNNREKSTVFFTLASLEGTEEDMALGLSYIRPEEGIKAFTWRRDAMSAALRINPTTGVKDLVFGSTDGYVLQEDHPTRLLPGSTAYNMDVETPNVTLADGDQPMTIADMYVKSRPVGDYDLTVSLTRDSASAQEYKFNQGTTGAIWGTSVFGTGVFGGGVLQTAYPNNVAHTNGNARSVKFKIQQGGNDQGADVYEVGLKIERAAQSRVSNLDS